MDTEDVVYIYNGILLSHEKEGNPDICNNRNGPWGHYVKWHKPDRERQTLHGIAYMWDLNKKSNSQTQSRKVIASLGVGEIGRG